MTQDWQRLERELRELEKRDPAVKASRQRLDEVTSEYQIWRRQMVRDLWGEVTA